MTPRSSLLAAAAAVATVLMIGGLTLGVALGGSARAQSAESADTEPLFRPVQFPAGAGPVRIGAGDLNGDGLPDVVVANFVELRALLNLGGELFGAPLATPGGVEDLVVSDLDGDGLADVAAARHNAAWLDVHRGLGDGSFLPRLSYPLEAKPSDMAWGDVNGDGRLDVVTVGNSVRGSVLLGNADGSFQPVLTFGSIGSNGAVDVGDLTGDGLDDVIVTAVPSGTLYVFVSNGDGSFVKQPEIAGSFYADAPRIGDFNGDGVNDVLAHSGIGTLGVLAGHGDGSFEPWTLIADTQSFYLDPTDAVAVDLDEDGVDDYVWAAGKITPSNTGSDCVGVARGTPALAPQTPRFYGTDDFPNRLAVADFNGDGDLDAVTVDQRSETISLLWGDGDGTFWPTYHTGDLPLALQTADLDDDGRLDLVSANSDGSNSNDVTVYLGRGNGRFTLAETLDAGLISSPSGLAIADFTDDGVPDLLPVADFDFPTKTLHVLPGLGDGSFGPRIDTVIGFDCACIAVGDLNGDDRPDLVARDDAADRLRVLLGQGDGHFASAGTYDAGEPSNEQIHGLVLGDFNGDGKPDIVVQNDHVFAIGFVQLLAGVGDGSFLPPVEIATGLGVGNPFVAGGLDAGDLDGDGDLDLVLSDANGPRVGVMLGHGDGSFDTTVANDTAGRPNSVRIGDVTADGVPDLVVADDNPLWSGFMSVLVGHGDGSFLTDQIFTVAANPYDVAIADFDGDGHGDVVTTAGATDGLQVHVNRRGPWDDLGLPLPGALGKPRMTGVGTLAPGGSTVQFHLHDARPSAATILVAGASGLFAPFKGGTMVPNPQVLLFPLPTNAAGDYNLSGPWPTALPAGIPFHFQFWTPDPAGPHGFSASNGLRGTTP